MAGMRFEVTERKTGGYLRTIIARGQGPAQSLRLRLDTNTGEVLWPVEIKLNIPGVTIMLDSAKDASCSLPPSVHEEMVDMLIAVLNTMHDSIRGARDLIKEEQEKYRLEKGSGQ